MNLPKVKTPKELIEAHNAAAYVLLAKIGLWVAATTLFCAIIGGLISAFSTGTTTVLLAVVQACQALAFIAITVLGYHGYKGHRLFHELRHFNDAPEATTDAAPEAAPVETETN